MHTLITEEMPESFYDLLNKQGLTEWFHQDKILFSEEIEILLIRTKTIVDSSYFKRFPNLKLVIRAGSGYDNVDLIAASDNGVKVCHTPFANAPSAFEHTLSFIMAGIKQHHECLQAVINKQWKSNLVPNLEVADLRALVVGVGRIGTRVGKWLQDMGAEVRGVDPFLSYQEWKQKGIQGVSYEEGLSWCNLITFHCPLTSKTMGYFDRSALRLLHEPIRLINTSRGQVVEEDAVSFGLQSNLLLSVALDVFDEEPWDVPEWSIDGRLYLSPHVGAYTEKAKQRLSAETLQTWSHFVKTGIVTDEAVNWDLLEQKG